MKQTGIEKIKQHIGECHLRLEQKRVMWVQAQNKGDWLESESLGEAMNVERAFVQGLERALAYVEGEDKFLRERLTEYIHKDMSRTQDMQKVADYVYRLQRGMPYLLDVDREIARLLGID